MCEITPGSGGCSPVPHVPCPGRGLTVRLGPGPRGRRRLLVLQRGGGGGGRGRGRRDEEPLEAVGWPAGHLQAGRQLGLVGAGEPLEVHEQLRLVAAEVRAVEVVERPVARRPAAPWPRPGPRRARPAQHHLAEAVEVELADEAGEVGGFEELGLGPGAPHAAPAAAAPAAATTPGSSPCPRRAEQLGLEERLVDEQPLAAAVPADRAVPGTVHQPPQLGGEVVGVDGGGEQRLLHRPRPGTGTRPAAPGSPTPFSISPPPSPGLRCALPPSPSLRPAAADPGTVGARAPAAPSSAANGASSSRRAAGRGARRPAPWTPRCPARPTPPRSAGPRATAWGRGRGKSGSLGGGVPEPPDCGGVAAHQVGLNPAKR